MNIDRSTNQKVNNTKIFYDHINLFFNGQSFSCHNFGHNASQCVSYKTIMTREARNQRRKQESRKVLLITFLLLNMELNVHFVITLVMKNLNAGENFGQHFKRRNHCQIPRYGERRKFNKKDVA